MNCLKAIIVFTLALGLSACITVTESRFSKKADANKAAEAYVALGVAYMTQHNMAMARQKLDRALELEPDNVSAHSAIATYWLERGEESLAVKEFEIALDLDDEHSPSNFHYGRYLMVYKRDAKACEYLSLAASDVNYSARSLANESLGKCWLTQENNSKAIDAFEKAWTLNSDSSVASFNLSKIYFKRKRVDIALRWFKRLENSFKAGSLNHSAATLKLGWRLAKASGNKSSAANYAFKLKKRFPKSVEYKLISSNR